MKTYCEPTLDVRIFDSDIDTEIVRTSSDPNAVFNANDVFGNDPGFWEVKK